MSDPTAMQESFTTLYYGRRRDIVGRVIHRTDEGFKETDCVIASVNPELPDGDQIANDIAAALNLKFT